MTPPLGVLCAYKRNPEVPNGYRPMMSCAQKCQPLGERMMEA